MMLLVMKEGEIIIQFGSSLLVFGRDFSDPPIAPVARDADVNLEPAVTGSRREVLLGLTATQS